MYKLYYKVPVYSIMSAMKALKNAVYKSYINIVTSLLNKTEESENVLSPKLCCKKYYYLW